MKDWVVLTTLPLITEAETLRARLQAEGIGCTLQIKRLSGDDFSRAATGRNNPATEVRVLVRAEDLERARAVLERLEKSRRKTRVRGTRSSYAMRVSQVCLFISLSIPVLTRVSESHGQAAALCAVGALFAAIWLLGT